MTTPARPLTPNATPGARAMRAAARKAPLAGKDKTRVITIRANLGRRAELVVLRSGLADWFEAQLPARDGRATGGPRRELTVAALLVGVLLLALAEQRLILRDLADLLNKLSPSQKHRLGIPRGPRNNEPAVTERMVSALFNNMCALIDPSPHSERNRVPYEKGKKRLHEQYGHDPELLEQALAELRVEFHAMLAEKRLKLRYVMDAGVEATLPDDVVHTGSYAIDSSPLPTWAHKYRKTPRAPWLHPDPDATRRAKPTRTDSLGWLGYAIHSIVRVAEVGGEDVPCVTERVDLTPADVTDAEAGVALVQRMCADHERLDEAAGRAHRPRGVILPDRAYTPDTRHGDRWSWPLFDLGFETHFDLTASQLGVAAAPLANGAIVIDGLPYSPRTPLGLRELRPPNIGASKRDWQVYQRAIAERGRYALHAVGGRHDTGSWDFGCRAMAALGQLICDLKPASMALQPNERRTVVDPTVYTPRTKPAICGQETARVYADELPYWQQLIPGSLEHYLSVNRRNRVEGYFGNVKNSAAQDVNRGNMRVMGLAKTSFLVMFFVMAANMRLLDTFEQRQARKQAEGDTPPVKQTRQPRYRTRQRREMRERIAQQAAGQQRLADIGRQPPDGADAHDHPPPGELWVIDLTEPPADT
jgi:hypothetical protein